MNKNIQAVLCAFLAALFYAFNTPFSKVLLRNMGPTYLASFLYFGAGIGIGIIYLFQYPKEEKRKHLAKKDFPYVVSMVLLDIVAPIAMMFGIQIGNAANASLLNNFEIVATTMIGTLMFKEKVSKRLFLAIIIILLSSILLSIDLKNSLKFSFGSLLVILATICWGFENNCTSSIAHKSNYQIVIIKGIGSGAISFVIANQLHEEFPSLFYIVAALLLGFIAYGCSIFLYVKAQNVLGACKTSAYYACVPFISTFLSMCLLKEPLSYFYWPGLILMLVGSFLIVKDSVSEYV